MSHRSPLPTTSLPITRALSVRQPYIELILAGRKTIEYRSRRTHVRERVYLYASTFPGPDEAFAAAGMDWNELPRGLILGSVEIIGCERGDEFDGRTTAEFNGRTTAGCFEWQLARPERLPQPLRPTRRPQPLFFFPFAKPAVTSST